MCLFVENLNFKTAKEDIVCYKVLKKFNSKIITPYMVEEVCFNTVITLKNKILTKYFFKGFFLKLLIILKRRFYKLMPSTDCDKVSHISYSKFSRRFIIEEGVIHLCVNKTEALKLKSYLWENPKTFICKAIIPKGTKYIESSDKMQIGALCVKYESI